MIRLINLLRKSNVFNVEKQICLLLFACHKTINGGEEFFCSGRCVGLQPCLRYIEDAVGELFAFVDDIHIHCPGLVIIHSVVYVCKFRLRSWLRNLLISFSI